MISGVPEGKGVSSSAAIEVATMSALAASHGKKNTLFLLTLESKILWQTPEKFFISSCI